MKKLNELTKTELLDKLIANNVRVINETMSELNRYKRFKSSGVYQGTDKVGKHILLLLVDRMKVRELSTNQNHGLIYIRPQDFVTLGNNNQVKGMTFGLRILMGKLNFAPLSNTDYRLLTNLI